MGQLQKVPDFSALSVAVAGDLICDHYLVTEPRGLSREAPVMVLRHTSEHIGAGGAANVARNLRALGASTRVLGVVGRDARGRELAEVLERAGVDVRGLLTVPGWDTPTKTRVVAAEPRRNLQQVLRIDREPSAPADLEARKRVVEGLIALSGEIDALVISDYEYGSVDASLATAARELVARGKVVVLDPRNELAGFDGLTALTPNVGELARFTGRSSERINEPRELQRAARELLERIRCRYLLVTRGNLGMALFGSGLPAEGVAVEASGTGNVTDVTGAGDTAAAVFSVALAAGVEAPRAMQLANAASGVVVMEHGVTVCTPQQLREALPLSPSPVRLIASTR
jgi:D-glycero-beta-D-manno-heptose-7-phosphate kinase